MSLGETFSAGELILLVAILPYLIPRSGVDLQISFSIDEAGVKSGPCGHEELFLIGTHINNAIFVFHEMFEAGSGIKYLGNTHRVRGETRK